MSYYVRYSSVVHSSAIHRTSRRTMGNQLPYYKLTGYDMPEFISSPLFLIIAAILAIFLVIALVKGAIRLFI